LGRYGLGPFNRYFRSLVDLREQVALRLRKLLDAGAVAGHQRLDFLQPVSGFGLLRRSQGDVDFLGLNGTRLTHLGDGHVDVGRRPRQPDAAGSELHLAHAEMGRERALGHPLQPIGAVVRHRHRGFRRQLVGNQADRQQHTDDAGETQFVTNAIELDHGGGDLCAERVSASDVCRALQFGSARRPHQTSEVLSYR
jgi:hypothetical protein